MEMKTVSANFFEVYGIAPAAGRMFQSAVDKDGDPTTMVVNAVAARALGFASAEQAVGQTVTFTAFDNAVIIARIVGIAPELRFRSLREPPAATAYALGKQGMVLSVRAQPAHRRKSNAPRKPCGLAISPTRSPRSIAQRTCWKPTTPKTRAWRACWRWQPSSHC
jgi:hypothetical protein